MSRKYKMLQILIRKLTTIARSNEILGQVGAGKIKPFRTVSSLNFPPFATNDVCLIGT
jgi:hypothetical protein